MASPARTSVSQWTPSNTRVPNYQPTMLHAKVLTIDGHVANLGF